MSEKYSVEEMMQGLQSLANSSIRNAILAKLRAGEKLCEAARGVDSVVAGDKEWNAFCKAISDYEEK